MGMLFGGFLSRENEVLLLEKDPARVAAVAANGVTVTEPDGAERRFSPRIASIGAIPAGETAELVIVFVKSMHETEALDAARPLIGPDTLLMTLQNGVGHEEVLCRYAPPERVVIGTTQDNASVLGPAAVKHGGAGKTGMGLISGPKERLLALAENFTRCGFAAEASDNVKRLIWNKLFLNASASALTALFQVPLGFVVDEPHAWALAEKLIAEAVAVANAEGQQFDAAAVTAQVRAQLEKSKSGLTSIYADLRDGRRTEVDTISGAVCRAGARLGVPTPSMDFVVAAIHAMESKGQYSVLSTQYLGLRERVHSA
jgi:2-dehydropantoate 2-reductase